MKNTDFSIDKTSSYQNGKREYESFDIQMNGRTICTVHRESAQDLFNQLEFALNDRKDEEHDKEQ